MLNTTTVAATGARDPIPVQKTCTLADMLLQLLLVPEIQLPFKRTCTLEDALYTTTIAGFRDLILHIIYRIIILVLMKFDVVWVLAKLFQY